MPELIGGSSEGGRSAEAATSLPAMRATFLVVVLALLTAGCASEQEPALSTATTRVDGPRDVVSGWLDAVVASDAKALAELVEPGGLVILAAIENGHSEEAIQALLDTGVPLEFIDDYWTSFRFGFADFAGIPLRAIDVSGHEEFMLGEVPFASVIVTSGEGVTSVMVSKRDGQWHIDLIGSFGPAFAAQLRRMLVNLSDTTAGDRIRSAFRSDVIPGLLAAFRRAPGNRVLGAELERMALLLEE